jgi:CubicO group peptidase (beta-lactamase class C family)
MSLETSAVNHVTLVDVAEVGAKHMSCHHRLLSFLLFFGAVTAHAQPPRDVSGRWQGTFDIPAPGGTTQRDTAFLLLQQNGTQVTGGAGRSEQMQTPLSDGVFRNGRLTFAVQVRPGTIVRFDLVLQGDHLRGVATGLPPDATARVVVDVARLPHPTVDTLLQHFMGSILIVREGQVLADRSFGSANLEWQIPNTASTRFRIGSLTKQFTAASILLLAERGKLRLEDPVSKYLENPPVAWSGITVLHLITHTSGIVSITDLPGEQAALTRGGTPAEIVERFRNQPLLFPPGTQARYSNSGYILLGMVMEKASGEPYVTFLQKNIFDPLGMRDTGIDNDADILQSRASGYRIEAGTLRHADFIDMRIPFAAGDLYSTTYDLARWQEALFGGKLLQPNSLKRMITPGKENFGLGVVVKQQEGERVISHTGGIQGFVAELRYYPGKHLSVIVLSNTESKETLELSEQLSRQALSGALSLVAPAGTLRDQILSADRQLFDAYNTCNTVQFSRSLASDLEFFHDSTGLTGHDWNVNALEKRCAESTKYHRSLDEQSVQIFPVPGYGALEIGTHRFYEKGADGSEKLDATPGFANVWKQTPDGWKLTRVLSYGHP